MTETKHCSACNQDKPLSEFWRCARTPDKLQGYCKTCNANRVKRWKNTGSSVPLKECRACGAEKPASEFYKGKRQCKKCANKERVTRLRAKKGQGPVHSVRIPAADPEPPNLRVYRERCRADERTNEAAFDALAANTAAALGRA